MRTGYSLHQLTVVVTAAACAAVAGYRSYTAFTEWVADVPAASALALGTTPDRRSSEATIRRLLQAVDPHLLSTTIGVWLAGRATTTSASGRAIASITEAATEASGVGLVVRQGFRLPRQSNPGTGLPPSHRVAAPAPPPGRARPSPATAGSTPQTIERRPKDSHDDTGNPERSETN